MKPGRRLHFCLQFFSTMLFPSTILLIAVLWPFVSSAEIDSERADVVMQTGHTGYLRAIDVSQTGAIAVSGADDSSVRVWSLASGIELRRIFTGAPVRAVALSPDGRSVAVMSFQSVAIWDIESGARKQSWSYFDSNAYVLPGVSFNRQGTNIVVADNGHVFVWNVHSRKLVHMEPFPHGIVCFAAHPDSDMLALCQGDSVVLWNMETFQRVSTLGPPESTFPLSDEFTSSYRELVNTAKSTFGDTSTLPDKLDPALVMNADFSKDLQFVVTNHLDGSLRLWDLATGREVKVIRGEVYDHIAVNPVNRTLAAATADRIVIRNMMTGDIEGEFVPPASNQSWFGVTALSRTNGKVCPLRYSPDGLQLAEGMLSEHRL